MKNRMNIVIATDKFQPSGGMERYIFDIAEGLLAKQITPKIFAMQISSEYEKIYPTHKIGKFPIAQFRYAVFNAKLQNRLPENHKLIATSLIDNADILFCGGNHLAYLDATNKTPTLKDKMMIKRSISAYKTAKKIVAHSQRISNELQEFYKINPEKIITIYPPVNTENFYILPNKKRQELRKKFGFNDNENILLFPSANHKLKGLDLIIESIKSIQTDLHNPIKIAVCGKQPAIENDLTINLGFITNMPELYNAVDFTILASMYEAFGLVGVESVLCGTKIIFATTCGCTEIIKNTDDLFFDRNQLQTLTKSLLISDKLKSNNQHRINNPFAQILYNPSIETHIDKLLEII